MNAHELIPKPPEIRRQLQHMLAGARFLRAPSQAELLQVVVDLTLAGEKTTEDTIGVKLFPQFEKNESTDVRVTIKSLRKTLKTYYLKEGRDDLVIIVVNDPPADKTLKPLAGEAYRPHFSYNLRYEPAVRLRLALELLRLKNPFKLPNANVLFKDVAKSLPWDSAGYVGMAETCCLIPFWLGIQNGNLLIYSQETAKLGALMDQSDWHACAVYAACWMLLRDFVLADAAFMAAFKLNNLQARKCAWFYAFLFILDKTENAMALLAEAVEESLEDAYLHAIHALFLYLLRQYADARQEIDLAIGIDQNCWVAYLTLALVQLSSDDASDAYSSVMSMQRALALNNDEELLFPGLTVLSAAKNKHLTEQERASLMQLVERIDESQDMPYSQVALAFMAEGDNERAGAALCYAWEHYDPVILFAHLLPIFDDLRGLETFKALLENRLKPRFR